MESLSSLIELRVQAIDADDPQRGRKAFRVFLEAVLLAHFGERFINDPMFYQLIDNVQDALESDANARQLVDSAIETLLKQSN